MMEKIIKDVGDIQSRLIDHRPVLQGEIRYFLREFEEKRAFRECRLLENLNKMISDTNDHDLPQCTAIEAANHMAQRIQQRELEAEQSTHVQVCVEKRRQDWEEFLKEQGALKEDVDEEHTKAVSRLTAQYDEMKKDLSKYSGF
ncbi:biogenesis of lysosome-related organelles complex 1 subunit 5-like isoform X2 [Myxocyprinus asiaticus]|uniref:biogenesis of lysosome-related organelles complex 1 subunit 5-like isoform X2 n=1 Tax=Myxocyprinus asiaticus TaxID=70543 RepID=UPI002221DA9E|nr:biogenesis of lysosome-related organelles complex 1 subunit 5-like isoform X2 [Myxocyprinus asiaticus]